MKNFILILLHIILFNLYVTGQNQKATILSFVKYFNQNLKGNFIILDIYNKPYKIVSKDDSIFGKGQLYIDSSLYPIDTTIIVGFGNKRIDDKNQDLLFKYYRSNIKPPKFQSENETSIFSFLLDENANVLSIKILKDVTNKCTYDSNWTISYSDKIKFLPTIINGKNYKVEYILKLTERSYFICDKITKEATPKSKKK